MVYIKEWNEYQEAVENLYLNSPTETRYVADWRHSKGKLVLKVTDNSTALKYKTDQASDLKKFEHLNRSLMLKMQNRKETSKSTEVDVAVKVEGSNQAAEALKAADSVASSSSTTSQTSSKKKKKKK